MLESNCKLKIFFISQNVDLEHGLHHYTFFRLHSHPFFEATSSKSLKRIKWTGQFFFWPKMFSFRASWVSSHSLMNHRESDTSAKVCKKEKKARNKQTKRGKQREGQAFKQPLHKGMGIKPLLVSYSLQFKGNKMILVTEMIILTLESPCIQTLVCWQCWQAPQSVSSYQLLCCLPPAPTDTNNTSSN